MPVIVEVVVSRLTTFVVGLTLLLAWYSLSRVSDTPGASAGLRHSHRGFAADPRRSDRRLIYQRHRLGGRGPKSWTARAWRALAQHGVPIAADVAAEGGAGYGVPGDHGSVFGI